MTCDSPEFGANGLLKSIAGKTDHMGAQTEADSMHVTGVELRMVCLQAD